MKILFFTREFLGASLCLRLVAEGHQVKAHVTDPESFHTLDGWIEKFPSLPAGLDWVGRDGLIIFDDIGFGVLQDQLRREGFFVVGASEQSEKLEENRSYGQRIFLENGLKTIPSHLFSSAGEAAQFVEKNGGEWVVKRNGRDEKMSVYVGKLPDGRDVANLLRHDVQNGNESASGYILQKRIRGIEMATGRFFNGTDWVGPVQLNVEHKKLFPGDLGPMTGEMGTLVWHTGEQNRLFQEILAPLQSYLRKSGFRGYADINCMVNEEGAWPLEATIRFGYPTVQAQMALHESPWGELLSALARGQSYPLHLKSGYSVVVLVACPPFPFSVVSRDSFTTPRGLHVHFKTLPSEEDFRHIHFEDVDRHPNQIGGVDYIVAYNTGFVLHVTGHGDTVEKARQAAYQRISNIVIPRMYYRTDIGEKFLHEDEEKLRSWGYL